MNTAREQVFEEPIQPVNLQDASLGSGAGAEEIDFSGLQRELDEIQRRQRERRDIDFEIGKRRVEDQHEETTVSQTKDRLVGTSYRGRRYIRWVFRGNLERILKTDFMEKIRENVTTSFYCRYYYALQLRNIEDGSEMVYYKQSKGASWINRFAKAEEWIHEQEVKRLEDHQETENTKWIPKIERFAFVELKVILDRQPLVETGPLPDWLRNLARGKNIVTLDTYRDNLCLWRCIAVHKGSRPDRSTKEAQELAKGFYKLKKKPTEWPKTSLDMLEKVEKYMNKDVDFADWLGVMVYEPERIEDEKVVWYQRRRPPAKLKNILTIGVYEGHAFVIKNIAKLAKIYECGDCKGRFTREYHLKTHKETCSKGKTQKICPGEKLEKPQTAYERAFYPQNNASKASLMWIEKKQNRGKYTFTTLYVVVVVSVGY